MDRHNESGRLWVGLGAVLGLGAVAMAAAAAHALAGRLEAGRLEAGQLAAVRGAVDIQAWHALALLFAGLWVPRGGMLAHAAAACFAAGVILFCAGVYAGALGGLRLPLVAPAGGTVMVLGWALLAASSVFGRR